MATNHVEQIIPGGDSTAVSIVEQRFTLTTGYATTAFEAALAFIDELKEIVNNIPDVDTDVDTIDDIVLDPPIDLMPYITNPPENPLTDEDFNIQIPQNLFSYVEDPYLSDLLDQLKAQLYILIQGEHTGLSASVEEQMFARETERDALANQDAKDKVASDWAERGMSYPDGTLFNALAQVEVEYQNKRLDKSRAIAEESRKLALDMTKHALSTAQAVEAMIMDYTGKKYDRLLKSAEDEMTATLETFKATIEVVKVKAEVYKAMVEAYSAQLEAIGKMADVQVALIKAKVEYALGKAQIIIAQLNAQIKELELKYGMLMEAAKAGSGVASQLAASALSAISAQAHIQYGHTDSHQSQISASESWDHKIEEVAQ